MSSDFDLLEQLLQNLSCKDEENIETVMNKEFTLKENEAENEEEFTTTTTKLCNNCSHENTVDVCGVLSCLDCGEEVGKNIVHDKEWRYYGQSDTKHKSDPSRCQMRKIEDKSILKDIEGMGFSDRIINFANTIYLQVTAGRIHRGNSRKAIIFACIFHAYKICNNPRSCDTLIEIFNITRKAGLKGLKYVNLNMPKDSDIIKNVHITPINIIDEIMNKFSASTEQKKQAFDLYEFVKDKSTKINRARPQSIAAGVTYFWICQNEKKISMKDFLEKVGLSEMTITRIANEIREIISI